MISLKKVKKQYLINKKQLFSKVIRKSYIWILIPIAFFGGFKSCSLYVEAGENLTPYSISVSGYYRQDGSYTKSYKRRPPGSVKRDAPWKRKRFFMGTLFFASLVIGVISIYKINEIWLSEINENKLSD